MWSNLFANLTVVGSIHAIPPTATGITPGSNVFVFSNAAGRSMLMNSSGRVGIGTANPTADLDVAGNVSVSNTVFIGNTFWTGANSTISVVGPATRLVFDNTTTPYAANKILLHSNTASANICGFGVTGLYNTVPITLSYYTSGGHSFSIGANQNFGGYEVFSISETGQFNFGGPAQQAKLLIGGSIGIPSNNTMMRIDSSNVALVTNGAGRVGFGTIAPTANLHVIGNVYASNALTTTNVFTTTANVGTLNVWQVSNLSTLSLTNNLYAANAVTTANLFTTTANVGTLNVWQVSNLSSLSLSNNLYAANAITTTNLFTAGITSNAVTTTFKYDTLTIPFMSVTTLNVASTSNLDTVTLTGEPGLTTLFASGNIYVSNAVTTTNVFATTVSTTNPVSFRNRVINGDFLVDQRNSGGSSIPTVDGKSTIDRWKVNIVGSGRCTVGQNLGAFASPLGFTSYYGMKVTTTSTPGAGDYFFLSQVIEGVNMVDTLWGTASARPVTLSFWVQSSIAGTAGGFVRNAGSSASNYTRSYPFTFTINNVLTWEYKTITIPGDTGTPWYWTQVDGIEFGIELWNGTNWQASPGAWASGNKTGPSGGTIDYAGTLNSVMNISGVQVEQGTVATPWERKLYNYELAACQRYYEPSIARLGGYNVTGGALRSSVYFNTKKRPKAAPTFTVISQVETPSNLGSLTFDGSNFDGSSARFYAPVTTAGDSYGQWSVSVDCEF